MTSEPNELTSSPAAEASTLKKPKRKKRMAVGVTAGVVALAEAQLPLAQHG